MNIVAHNMLATNAQRQFNIVGKNKAKSTEKLSSGYRINRAADDAAGLTISEKLRSQIRGLTQGVDNTQDGVSLCQVADGALDEVDDMLHRITELAVKSANGTNTQADRQAIQKEINQIISEIDRISDSTTFNEEKIFVPRRPDPIEGGMWVGDYQFEDNIVEQTVTLIVGRAEDGMIDTGNFWINGTELRGKNITFSVTGLTFGEEINVSDIDLSESHNVYTDVDACHTLVVDPYYYSCYNLLISNETGRQAQGMVSANGIACRNSLNDLRLEDLKVSEEGYLYFNSKDSGSSFYGTRVYLTKGIGLGWPLSCPEWAENSLGSIGEYFNNGSYLDTYLQNFGIKALNVPEKSKNIWIQSGCKAGDGMNLEIDAMNSTILGVEDVDVSTETGALSTLQKVEGALDKVNANRSKIGAQQNRLEHTIANENNIVENTTAAESQIRDTDMAKEMVNQSMLNILSQVGTSMMAQANQSNQSILQLLQ